MNTYLAELITVRGGKTIEAGLDLGFHTTVVKTLRIERVQAITERGMEDVHLHDVMALSQGAPHQILATK